MIDLYSSPTPNGWKVAMALEELNLPYTVNYIDLAAGDQHKPEFLAMNPNGRIPVIVDRDNDNFIVFETGAIMIYLAELTGKLLPTDQKGRSRVIQWLMFQMASVGPMLGQAHHFRNYAPKRIQYAYDRYTNEATRIYGVIDRQLKKSKFIANDKYSIADIAIYPWIRSHANQGQKLENYRHLSRWYEAVESRPAVQRGLQVLAHQRRSGAMSKAEKAVLFGAEQYKRR